MENEKPLIVAEVVGNMVSGGVESVLLNYYRAVNHEKIQFDFIVFNSSTYIPKAEIEKMGGRVYVVPSYSHLFAFQRSLKRLFDQNGYKIIHSHINTLSVFSLLVAKKAGIPCRIAHSHSTWGKHELLRNFIKLCLRPFSKVYATNLAACSQYSAKWLFGKKAVSEGRVFILRNAIVVENFQFFEEKRKRIRHSFGIDNETFVVGHVGRFVTQKNHRYLLLVFKKLLEKRPNSVLLLLGDGPLISSVKQQAIQLGIDKFVIFVGAVQNANEFYSAMDVFLLPSFFEGLPVSGVEAQTNGLRCGFSSKIGKETVFTNQVSFFGISNGCVARWVDFLCQCKIGDRNPNASALAEKAGFSIKFSGSTLENYYLNLVAKARN